MGQIRLNESSISNQVQTAAVLQHQESTGKPSDDSARGAWTFKLPSLKAERGNEFKPNGRKLRTPEGRNKLPLSKRQIITDSKGWRRQVLDREAVLHLHSRRVLHLRSSHYPSPDVLSQLTLWHQLKTALGRWTWPHWPWKHEWDLWPGGKMIVVQYLFLFWCLTFL